MNLRIHDASVVDANMHRRAAFPPALNLASNSFFLFFHLFPTLMRAISVILAVGAVAVTHAFITLPSGLSLGRDHPGALSQQPASHACQSKRKNVAIKRCALERTALLRLRAAEMTLGVSAEPPEEDPLADIPAVLMQDVDGMCIIAAKYSKNEIIILFQMYCIII
jgi:hypothetical protein